MAKGGFPGGMGGMGNMNNLMKQAKKMQEQMAKIQEELEEKTVEASVGGGVVSVIANGRKEIIEISIKPEAVDPDDVEMLQDLILAAVNEAMRKADEMAQGEMGKITGGMGMPNGLF
ncbi:MAG: YbaB/EbfC family nucleoid-associated protein [Clostridiales bacterium]|nr:YbaB/EbfC family nucleoid-associated protein [Clostridiales bacterium]